jgi:hypothetical protein
MNDEITTFPLSYPVNQPRTKASERKDARFTTRSRGYGYGSSRRHSVHESASELEAEIKRMGGKDMIISSNLRVKANGLPYSGQRQPDDPGVAVYFKWQKRDLVFACDKWTTVEDNLWAIVKHIEALRGQERWGVGSLDQAFAGYMALPDPEQRQWWEVLHVAPTASNDEIRHAYLRLAKQHHPDAGGDPVMFDQVQKAFDLATGKRGA